MTKLKRFSTIFKIALFSTAILLNLVVLVVFVFAIRPIDWLVILLLASFTLDFSLSTLDWWRELRNPRIKLKLDPKFKVVANTVKDYGYYDGPKCDNPECESELGHLIDDWQTNATDLKDYQLELDMTDEEFEKLLGTIYVADEIEYKEGVNSID